VNKVSQLVLELVLSAAGSRASRSIEGPLRLVLWVQGMAVRLRSSWPLEGVGCYCRLSAAAGLALSASQCEDALWEVETMAAIDQELLRLRALARRRPLQQRIIRSVASSTAIETRQSISSIEAKLLSTPQVVVNRRLITIA